MGKLWLKDEIELLTTLYEKDGLSLSELYPIFSEIYNRTIVGVEVKIGKLKLQHSKKQTSRIKSRLYSGKLNGMFGKTSPLKGLTKENSELIKLKSIKTSITRKEMFKNGELPPIDGENNPMYGAISWNNGLTKYDDVRISEYGKKISEIRKKEWSEKTEEEKNKVILRLNEAMIQVSKPTKIENKIEDLLKQTNISYVKNKRFGRFILDFYIPESNLVIECDGDYWHANPKFYADKELTDAQVKNVDRDNRKNKLLYDNNIEFIRIWEYDIHNNFEIMKNKIWEKLQKK